MTPFLRKVTLLACGLAVAATSAMAAVPSPADSDVPCGIILVGTKNGVADPGGQFTIVVRDFAQAPIPGSTVVIDFDACEIDIRICSAQPYSGVTANCSSGPVGRVSAVTDGSGSAVLRIVGAARNSYLGAAAEGFKCATVLADGVVLANINVAAFDQDGAGGVNPADLSLHLTDHFSAGFEGRSDYNCSNTINPIDLSLFVGNYFTYNSTTSCAAYCH